MSTINPRRPFKWRGSVFADAVGLSNRVRRDYAINGEVSVTFGDTEMHVSYPQGVDVFDVAGAATVRGSYNEVCDLPKTTTRAPFVPFEDRNVSITMTGAEWFAFCARIVNGREGLSLDGARVYNRATEKLNLAIKAEMKIKPPKTC